MSIPTLKVWLKWIIIIFFFFCLLKHTCLLCKFWKKNQKQKGRNLYFIYIFWLVIWCSYSYISLWTICGIYPCRWKPYFNTARQILHKAVTSEFCHSSRWARQQPATQEPQTYKPHKHRLSCWSLRLIYRHEHVLSSTTIASKISDRTTFAWGKVHCWCQLEG